VGIYATNNPEACKYVALNATCNVIVVENNQQLKKILQIWEELPALKAVVQYTGEVAEKRENVYSVSTAGLYLLC
jgi:long-chain-fatty-acid--CoA ligase ACSBG